MPRYYYHLYNDITAIDEEGQEHPNLAVAHQRAIAIAREMAAEAVRNGHLVLHHRIELADESGSVLETVNFRDVVEIEG
jgi:hypothetical protein